EEVADQVGVNVFGPPAHVLLFKARDSFADGGFDFALCFHGDLAGVSILPRRPAWTNTRTATARAASRQSSYDTSSEQQFTCFPGPQPYTSTKKRRPIDASQS